MARILVAGASGVVGGRVARRLVAEGHSVRTLTRDPRRLARLPGTEAVFVDALDANSLRNVADGMDIVVSCLGASVSARLRDRRAFSAVDPVANGNLLRAARASGVARFVYLSVHAAPGYATTRYCLAHERFAERLRATDVSSTVVRSTGIFTAFDDLLAMARSGIGVVIGDGRSRVNPVHPEDVSDAVVSVVRDGPADLEVGGPEILTRDEVMRAAFYAVGKRFRAIHVPAGMVRLQSRLLAPLHPRLSELFEFVAAVFTHDAIAEPRGTRRLADYYASRLCGGVPDA